MVTLKNNKKSVASYVVKEINTNSYIEKQANILYEYNMKKEPESILDVLEMITDMYYDFVWTCGYSENDNAKMDIELKQFIDESINSLILEL